MSYLDELVSIWESVKLSLKEKYTPAFVNLWFEDLQIVSYDQGVIVLSTISEFKHKLINEKHLPILKEEFVAFLGFEPEIQVIFTGVPTSPDKILNQMRRQDASEGTQAVGGAAPAKIPSGMIPQNYKFEYTFDNFIVGSSNKFAHAACTAVAAHPAENYNPLFIYGPSGIGKTHLLSAIVNEISKNKPEMRMIYIKEIGRAHV